MPTHHSSQETKSERHQIVIRTYQNKNRIETILGLDAPDFLDFRSQSDDARIPVITGRFLNADYEECLMSSTMSDQNITISGVVTKLDDSHALSTKTLSDSSSGKVIGVMQERVELILELEFQAALSRRE